MRNDKKLLWSTANLATGANTLWAKDETVLYDNSTGGVNMTIDKVDGEINIKPAGTDKIYYCMVFVTDPGGAVPTGLSGANDATFQSWLQTYRRQIWMNEGGFAKYNAAIPDAEVKLIPFEADTKRTLIPGQKLILIVMCRNTGSVADSIDHYQDFNLFFHY